MTRIWFRDPAVGPEPGAGGAPQAGEPKGLTGDPPLSLASAALESKHHPTPFRPTVPQGLQSPCVTDHSCVPVTAKEPYFSGSPWAVTGQQGLCWFCSYLNVWSARLCSGGCKVTRRKSDRWSNVGTDFLRVPSSGFPSSFTDGPYHRRCVVMDVGPLVLSNTDELFDREEFSSPRFQMASYFYWRSISLPSVPWNA